MVSGMTGSGYARRMAGTLLDPVIQLKATLSYNF